VMNAGEATPRRTLLENAIEWSKPNGGRAPPKPDQNPGCTASGGSCIDTTTDRCVGTLKSRLCPVGGTHVLCCIPRSKPLVDPNPGCTAIGGSCINTFTHTCTGNLKRRICPGGGDGSVCCIGVPEQIPTAPNPRCTEVGGLCQATTAVCHGTSNPGLCNRVATDVCCISEHGPTPLPPPPAPSADVTIARLKRRTVPEKKVAAVVHASPAHTGPGPIEAGAAPAPLHTAAMGGESMGSTIRRADPRFEKRLPNQSKQYTH